MALLNHLGPEGLGLDDVLYESYNNDSDDLDDDDDLGGEELSGGGLEHEDLAGGMLADEELVDGGGGLEHEDLAGSMQVDGEGELGDGGLAPLDSSPKSPPTSILLNLSISSLIHLSPYKFSVHCPSLTQLHVSPPLLTYLPTYL